MVLPSRRGRLLPPQRGLDPPPACPTTPCREECFSSGALSSAREFVAVAVRAFRGPRPRLRTEERPPDSSTVRGRCYGGEAVPAPPPTGKASRAPHPAAGKRVRQRVPPVHLPGPDRDRGTAVGAALRGQFHKGNGAGVSDGDGDRNGDRHRVSHPVLGRPAIPPGSPPRPRYVGTVWRASRYPPECTASLRGGTRRDRGNGILFRVRNTVSSF